MRMLYGNATMLWGQYCSWLSTVLLKIVEPESGVTMQNNIQCVYKKGHRTLKCPSEVDI